MNQQRVYLREWRIAKGLTQPELAKRTGTVKSEISRLEKGSRRMTLEWMKKSSNALGITIDDLMALPPVGFGVAAPVPIRQPTDGWVSHAVGDLVVSVPPRYGFIVTGEDWVPDFTPGDAVIYDTTKTSAVVPGLYAVSLDGETLMRRVIPGAKDVIMSCANASYPPVPLGKAKIAGRVVARLHRA